MEQLRSITFTIEGDVTTLVTVTEMEDGSLRFDLEVVADAESAKIGDLRAFYFDLVDEDGNQIDGSTLALSTSGDDVTDDAFGDSVDTLGGDTNIKGSVSNELGDFSVGVEFGTAGSSRDDIQSTSFYLTSADGLLSLDNLNLADFGIRYTSVGEADGNRTGSSKLGYTGTGVNRNDTLAAIENGAGYAVNLLANDQTVTETGAALGVTVTELNSLQLGGSDHVSILYSDDGIDLGTLTVASDGSASFDARADALAEGETRVVSVQYVTTAADGALASAWLTITVTGMNDAPTVSATATAGFVEAEDASAQTLTDSGTVSFDDVDATDLIDIGFAFNNDITWSGGEIETSLAKVLVEGFWVGVSGAAAPGSTPWTYSAAELDLDFLAEGETISWSYTVTATDGAGATATDSVHFTITGTEESMSVPRLGLVLYGIGAGDRTGFSVAAAGDVNGDGIDDFIVGAPGADGEDAFGRASNVGETYVVFGRDTVAHGEFPLDIDLALLDGRNGFVLKGIDRNDEAGGSVHSAGDVNGDGIDDILIGARSASGISTGETYVVFGRDTATEGDFAPSFDLASLDGTNGFVLKGIDRWDFSGTSVSSIGDTNGDGIPDILIGAPLADPATLRGNAGENYLVFGGMDNLGNLDASDGSADGTIDLSRLDGTNGYVLNGISFSDLSGFSVSSAGDMNGDGFEDILIGAYQGEGNIPFSSRPDAGETYVVFGGKTLLDFFDLADGNRNGSIDLGLINGTNGFVLTGESPADWSGYSVSSVGDVNEDGFDDILIGTNPVVLNGGFAEAYLVFGKGSGFSASFDLANMNGTNGFVFKGSGEADLRGASVSSAGDVNGDGIGDFLIGGWSARPNGVDSGKVHLVFGGDENLAALDEADGTKDGSIDLGNLDGTSGYVLNGIGARDRAGQAVSAAGDVDGDGIGDILIGAPGGLSTQTAESYVVFGGMDVFEFYDSLDGTTDGSVDLKWLKVKPDLLAADIAPGKYGFLLSGIDADDRSGFSVATAGDVNGDGIDDFLIGAWAADPNDLQGAGETYVVFGKDTAVADPFPASFDLAGLDGRNGFVVNGIAAGDFTGYSVSSAGDVNGDGVDDILIGVWDNVGQAYIVFGKDVAVAGAFDAFFDLENLDGSNGFIVNGIDPGDNAGGSVSSAGDVNGDGIDDLLIGAFGAAPNGSSSGEAYVIFGRDAVNDGGFAQSFDLADLNGTNGFVLNGAAFGDRAGISVSAAGDVNGDGIADILIGANGADPNNIASGATYLVFGKDTDFSASFDLSALDGSNGYILNGIDWGDNSGASVSSAGDVNGDGFVDILIGAYSATPNGASSGEAYVVFGGEANLAALDGDNDGKIDLVDLNGTNGFVLKGIAVEDRAGWSVSEAGDVDGDGIGDILIGAYTAASNGFDFAGRTYLVFGKDTGFSASFDLSTLDGTNGYMLNGVDADDYSGYSVSSAGDVNGDGFDDILIGAHSANPNGLNLAGESYVIFGGQANLSEMDGIDGWNDGSIDLIALDLAAMGDYLI